MSVVTTRIKQLVDNAVFGEFPRTVAPLHKLYLVAPSSFLAQIKDVEACEHGSTVKRKRLHQSFYYLHKALTQMQWNDEIRRYLSNICKGEYSPKQKKALQRQQQGLIDLQLGDIPGYQNREKTVQRYIKLLCFVANQGEQKTEEIDLLNMELQCADYYPAYVVHIYSQLEQHCNKFIYEGCVSHISFAIFDDKGVLDDMSGRLYTAMQLFVCPEAFFLYGLLLALNLVTDNNQRRTVLMGGDYVHNFRSENFAFICAAALGNPDVWLVLAYQYKISDPAYATYCLEQTFGKGHLFADIQYILAVFENDAMKTMSEQELHRLALILMYSFLWLDKDYVPSALYFIKTAAKVVPCPLATELSQRLMLIAKRILLAVRQSTNKAFFYSSNEGKVLVWISLILQDRGLVNDIDRAKFDWRAVMPELDSLQDSELLERMGDLYFSDNSLQKSQKFSDSAISLASQDRGLFSGSRLFGSDTSFDKGSSDSLLSSHYEFGRARGESVISGYGSDSESIQLCRVGAERKISPLVEGFFFLGEMASTAV